MQIQYSILQILDDNSDSLEALTTFPQALQKGVQNFGPQTFCGPISKPLFEIRYI